MSRHRLNHNRGAGNRHQQAGHVQSGHGYPAHGNVSHQHVQQEFRSHGTGSPLPVQQKKFVPQHFPFQPLPPPNGQSPFRFDLSQLLHSDEVEKIAQAGKLVFHSVGDTGDERGKEMDFVARMMTDDYDASPDGEVPAFFYHLGDVVYFAGDIDKYGECFYETYAEYPALIVSIPGNHDCQPDDPQDGPVDPAKKPLDGWVQNFMSKEPNQLGSLKTTSSRTQMDLPNPYWTLTTPFATIIGQRFTVQENGSTLPCVVAGNGGYSKLGKLHKVDGQWPEAPMQLSETLRLEEYDQDRFGFLRFEVSKNQLTGIYTSAIFAETRTPDISVIDRFTIDLKTRRVTTTT